MELVKKLYTVGTIKHNVAGHGDSYGSIVIQKDGWYETGKFPPLFLSKKQAQEYLESFECYSDKEIVELEVA